MANEPQGQTEWGWKVAAYLFLEGAGGGAYVAGVLAGLAGPEWLLVSKAGVALGFPLVLLGTLFLLADLGVKERAYRAISNLGTSWVSRGTLIVTIFLALSLVDAAGSVWPSGALRERTVAHAFVEALGLVFALMTMIYTAVLLGASRPIAFWSTAALPIVFVSSSLLNGVMAIGAALYAFGAAANVDVSALSAHAARAVAILAVVEAGVLLFYLQATHRTTESRSSAGLLLRGRLAGAFWFGAVLLGIVVPLVVSVAAFRRLEGPAVSLAMALGVALPGLVGGLVLRHLILAAGARAPLRAGGITYVLPTPVAR